MVARFFKTAVTLAGFFQACEAVIWTPGQVLGITDGGVIGSTSFKDDSVSVYLGFHLR
jgi:hypothetical protein